MINTGTSVDATGLRTVYKSPTAQSARILLLQFPKNLDGNPILEQTGLPEPPSLDPAVSGPRWIADSTTNTLSIAPAVEQQDGNAKEKSSADRTTIQAVSLDTAPMPRAIASGGDTHVSQDLREFLGNWFKLGDGAVSTATTGTIFSVNLPSDFVYQTQVRPKILGYQGYSADHVVRFMINANDNHACRLIFWQLPFIDAPGLITGDVANDIYLYSQLEHTSLDVATESGIDITVPWKYHLPFFDIFQATGGVGYNISAMTVAMSIYAPLLTGASGSTSFNYSVYVRAIPETIKLYNPILNPDAPGAQRSQMADNKVWRKREPGAGLGTWGASGATTSIAGVKLLKFSDLTKPSWYLKVGANVLEFMGYSKPKMDERNQLFYQAFSTNRATLNCDGQDSSANLALCSTNSVIPMPLCGVDHDELSIEYLVRKPYYFSLFNWTTSQVTGTTLYTAVNHPSVFYNSGRVVASKAAGPLCYLKNFFRYWRGPIMLRFLFNKTPYHQGRLQFTYQPVDFNVSPATVTSTNSVYLHREIVDVSEESDVTFLMPFTFNAPYNSTDDSGTGIGSLTVTVLNELVAPVTCSATISCIVEVCAGPGFEYAVPRAPGITLANFLPPAGKHGQRSQASAGVSVHRDRSTDKKVRTFGYTTRSFDYAATCVGEPTLSVRQLLLAGTTMNLGTQFPSTDTYLYIRPGVLGIYDKANSLYAFGAADNLSLLAPLFAVSRGSLRIEFRSTPVKSNEFWIDTIPYGTSWGGLTIPSAKSGTTMAATFPIGCLLGQGMRSYIEPNSYSTSVLVPHYGATPCYFNAVSTDDLSGSASAIKAPNGLGYDNRILGIRCYSNSLGAVYSFRRSIGEDFQMSCFTGVPYYCSPPSDVAPKSSDDSEAAPLSIPAGSLGSVPESKSVLEATRLPAAKPVPSPTGPSFPTKIKL